jgi:DUF4097 and DUF4098 domain-containing protein YvlB
MILGIRTIRRSLLVALTFSIPALAKCPVTDGTTVLVKAAAGDLMVDTNSRESAADVQVDNNAVQIQETCGKDVVQFINTASVQSRGTITWKIVVPKGVHLDLTTMAGNIIVGDVDGNAVLRTAGGSITAGRIKGRASLITQGGSIKSANIGGDAELRSQGGTLDVGDIGGNAELYATAGIIRAGNVTGYVNAEGGRLISIGRASDVKATTKAGDISIGDASRINAKSGGGSITSKRVRGPFQGHTDSGDIRLDSAASWVEASTASGNIYVKLVPDDLDGDLHMSLDAGTGDITVYLPPRLRASLDASIQRAAFQAQQIISDFPPVPARPPAQGLIPTIPNRFYGGTHSEFLSNGGGNKIVLHTGLGKITIRKN